MIKRPRKIVIGYLIGILQSTGVVLLASELKNEWYLVFLIGFAVLIGYIGLGMIDILISEAGTYGEKDG
jgi:hypothetical protein